MTQRLPKEYTHNIIIALNENAFLIKKAMYRIPIVMTIMIRSCVPTSNIKYNTTNNEFNNNSRFLFNEEFLKKWYKYVRYSHNKLFSRHFAVFYFYFFAYNTISC